MKKTMIIILLIILIFNVACEFDNNSNEIEVPKKDLIEVSGKEKDIINRSEDLSDMVVELFGVDDATTIILNNNALIGIILARDMELSEELIDTITTTVKSNDNLIEDVKITTNKNLFKEIDNIVTSLIGGDSYEKYLTKINKIENKISKGKN